MAIVAEAHHRFPLLSDCRIGHSRLGANGGDDSQSIYAALWFIVTLFGVAVLFAILNASFLAVVQVVVYMGAIAILFIFAVMLTHKEMRDPRSAIEQRVVVECDHRVAGFRRIVLDASELEWLLEKAADFPSGYDAVGQLGKALISPDAFVLPLRLHPFYCSLLWSAQFTLHSIPILGLWK